MAIRLATEREIDGVLALVRRAFRWSHPAADYPRLIDDGAVWALTQDSAVVGIAVLIDRPDHLLLETIAVDPTHRDKNFGKVLLSFAEREARERGYDQIRVHTSRTTAETLVLCRSFGYREMDRAGLGNAPYVVMSKPVL